jgi:PHP family Zn ribbon phosphoesterase
MSDLKIICSDCKKAFTIPEEEKESWTCPNPKCGTGHAMGIGPCIPHSTNDEFSTKRREKAPYM